jgi:hypothetical protein
VIKTRHLNQPSTAGLLRGLFAERPASGPLGDRVGVAGPLSVWRRVPRSGLARSGGFPGSGGGGSLRRFGLSVGLVFLVFAGWLPLGESQIRYSTDHPEVRQMVRMGVGFLRENFYGTFGEVVLSGLAILNSYEDNDFRNDARVNEAVQQVLRKIPDYAEQLRSGFENHNMPKVNKDTDQKHLDRMYESCVALMLLVEYDDQTYDREIRTLIDFIVRRQRPDGSWTYNFAASGDTSQSQYCCLALWLAHHKGFDIPGRHASDAVKFWVDGQAADGSWPYMVVPGQPQSSPHMSLVAAGAGSVYMLGDILGVNPPPKRAPQRKSGELFADLPPFVERLTPRELENLLAQQVKAPVAPAVEVNVTGLNASKQKANNWFAANFRTETRHWPYYALYGFERYATFREKIDGEVTEIPDWYDQGVEYINANQSADGSLPAGGEAGAHVQTALAVLFLVRSTQRLTNLPKDTTLLGGQGLGGNTKIRAGKVINEEEKRDIVELLTRVKSEMSPEELADIAESFRNVAVTSIKDKSRSQQLVLLREMVTNEHWQIRIVAVRALGQVRLIDNCPALIFALTDPNPEVVQEASIALQFVSRKTETPPVPTAKRVANRYDTQDQDYRQGIRELYQYWANWYLQLKPDAQLLPAELDQ